MQNTNWLRDPSAETTPLKRPRQAPPESLEGLTVGLFDIGKPTNAKVATPEIVQKVVDEADVVVIGLSD